MKIFCETHGQPLGHNDLTGEFRCKITGCTVAISGSTVQTLAQGLRTIKITEIWIAPK